MHGTNVQIAIFLSVLLLEPYTVLLELLGGGAVNAVTVSN
jgi:hypothetical protein